MARPKRIKFNATIPRFQVSSELKARLLYEGGLLGQELSAYLRLILETRHPTISQLLKDARMSKTGRAEE